MSYKGLILKIQKLQAYYNYEIETTKQGNFYNPYCKKEEYIRLLEDFSNQLDHILETEEYTMKKHFKY